MPLAIFGIDNTAINLGITFVILALAAIWIALIVFTFSDARRRIADPFLVACATAASFFPFVGTIVYTILRPPEFLDDVNERETEMKSAETRMRHLDAHSCRKCGFPAETDFVRCPACRTRLKEPCPSCDRPVGLKWKLCPYCEHTLIESKRSRSGAKAPAKATSKRSEAPTEPEVRLRRRDPEATEREAKPDRTKSDRAESSPRRSGRRAARRDTATPVDDVASKDSLSDLDPSGPGREPKPAKPDGGLNPATETINGGDADRPRSGRDSG